VFLPVLCVRHTIRSFVKPGPDEDDSMSDDSGENLHGLGGESDSGVQYPQSLTSNANRTLARLSSPSRLLVLSFVVEP
jgi:hypothetical protein